jgi:hypothetical protein
MPGTWTAPRLRRTAAYPEGPMAADTQPSALCRPSHLAAPMRPTRCYRVAESMATLFGPAVAGLLVAVLTPASVIAVDAATFAVSGVCLLAIRRLVGAAGPSGRPRLWEDLRLGRREFSSRQWLWVVLLRRRHRCGPRGPARGARRGDPSLAARGRRRPVPRVPRTPTAALRGRSRRAPSPTQRPPRGVGPVAGQGHAGSETTTSLAGMNTKSSSSSLWNERVVV